MGAVGLGFNFDFSQHKDTVNLIQADSLTSITKKIKNCTKKFAIK